MDREIAQRGVDGDQPTPGAFARAGLA